MKRRSHTLRERRTKNQATEVLKEEATFNKEVQYNIMHHYDL